MKYIILSDIHGNFQALESVIGSFPPEEETMRVSAGDVVGYGAEPDACIDKIRALGFDNIKGNHDAAVVGKLNLDVFTKRAMESVLWTKDYILLSGIDYLNGLPLVREYKSFVVVHGTLHKPEEFRYMSNYLEAMRTFEIMTKNICFVGHSHVSGILTLDAGRISQIPENKIKLQQKKYIINVGSVGQPRDGDNRASYCVYDEDNRTIEIRRIDYDVETARKKILDAGLPAIFGDRLRCGR
ncbi:MAG: metallophosphoesterase family protein [Candidatus Omnitrophota bacterium]